MHSLVLMIALALNAASILVLAYGSLRILWAAWLLRDLRYSLASASILLLALGLVGESLALYSVVLAGAGYGRWMALPRPYWAGTLSTPFVFLYPVGYALLLCSAYVGAEKENRSWGLSVVPLGWLVS